MRVLVTGARGFVGRWLVAELERAGHEVVGIDSEVDVRDAGAVEAAVRRAEPGAIAHLAAVSFAPDAASDPTTAFAVAVGGTVNVLEAARRVESASVVLVTGSSEVYGAPRREDLPLQESSPLRAAQPYALSKVAQESVAVAYGARFGLPVVVTRSFNHVGPRQRPDFVVPALAQRVAAVAKGEADRIRVGNVDVRRDLTDVRDVVRAYRLLLESAANGLEAPLVINVCSGESVAIRWIAEEFCRLANVDARLDADPALVRKSDPPEIRGDFALLHRLTGWRPTIPLADTLRDIWAGLQVRP